MAGMGLGVRGVKGFSCVFSVEGVTDWLDTLMFMLIRLSSTDLLLANIHLRYFTDRVFRQFFSSVFIITFLFVCQSALMLPKVRASIWELEQRLNSQLLRKLRQSSCMLVWLALLVRGVLRPVPTHRTYITMSRTLR